MTCAGAPLDRHGVVKETINDCPFAPAHVITVEGDHPEMGPITIVVTVCDLHRAAVLDYLGHFAFVDRTTAFVAEIRALPTIRRELEEAGEHVVTLQYQAA